MALADLPFDRRLRKIERTHKRMSRGTVYKTRSDGLITVRPRRFVPRFPLKGLILVVVAAFAFKAFLYASLGGTTYSDRVSELASGSVFERIGGWIMQADPATLWLVAQIDYFKHLVG